ncbi:phosphopyruvate hydratase [Helicobacter aurati]|uniref:Enolase n=1 Tax=Helicobacter aurati TaxID=137778 RepID=A0A3D8J881_9HELI|nr:phosphopyruvate hydratase [Helicobacter aurati]RDU73480.1 phosphopyruvate hydratase [Helicobacter aurati]
MVTIKELDAFEVLDSRGNPTICAKVILSDGSVGSAIVPSGASTGKREALELRDKDESRFLGKGVLRACANITEVISREIMGMEAYRQTSIDDVLKSVDNTENYNKLGANATLGVSMALARASAHSLNIPLFKYLGGINAATLPVPMLNIINGGSHANNTIDFQEYMIMPLGFDCFKRALRASVEVYHKLRVILDSKGFSTSIGDEGGFAPNLKNNEEPIVLILDAIQKAGYKPKEEFGIALDIAGSELYNNGIYHLKGENLKLDSKELVSYYQKLTEKYPIVSIEDGLSEDDWNGWTYLTEKLGNKIQLVGDDLFVTNAAILRKGISQNVANAILIKPNQIGTITQTLETIRLAQANGYKTVISHRSGESEDNFIADLSVAVNAGEIKTGAPARGERNAKYNRLLELRHQNKLLAYNAKTLFK